MDTKIFKQQMKQKGWVIFDQVIEPELVDRMKIGLEFCYGQCRSIQIKNGIADNNEFTVHHLIGQEDSFLEYLEVTPIHDYARLYFDGPFTLNSFGGAINTAQSRSYAHNIHRDVRSYSPVLPIMLNTLVMLDDFTEENGATWMLSGSHKQGPKPTEKEFAKNAEQAIGKRGSVLMFDSNVWHAGGENKTSQVRRSVTPMYSKPFVKQQFDYPRALGYENQIRLSPLMQQIIGYNARTPETLDEWYQPPEKRMYKRDQEPA